METRANYVLIGAFTLAIIAGVFGFVYWFQNTGGGSERAFYRVVFENTVSGLRTGGAVLFNGIRVGEVTRLQLDPQRPQQVVADLSIDKNVAVRTDTRAGIEFQGLTGIAAVGLSGGSADKPAITGKNGEPPVIIASRGSTLDVTQGARDVLRHVDEFIGENQKAFHDTMENLVTLSAALAKSSARLDHIIDNVDNLTGGADGKSGEVLEAVRSFRTLGENLDKRTAEISEGINRLTASSTRTIEQVGRDARGMIGTIDKTFKDLDKNPSRLLFGGSK
jgi:phospholipid/cholesterol/gamma-HCH transport system substrate-binding protein